MITVERPAVEAVEAPQPETKFSAVPEVVGRELPSVFFRRPRLIFRGLSRRASATGLVVTLLFTLGGSGGLANSGIPLNLQARAVSLHDRWTQMRTDGIPEFDLATLEQEWAYTQATKFMGVAAVFWWPGANEVLDRWQVRADSIWARDMSLYRAGAVAASQNLHHALGVEPGEQSKARMDALSLAATPGELALLRSHWDVEGRLVPIDRNIASATGALANQSLLAKNLGIRSDPAAEVLARAAAYAEMEAQERLGRAEFLTRALAATHVSLQGRLDAAAITQDALNHASSGIDTAGLYGIDLSGFQTRIDANRSAYGIATTPEEFNRITGDLKEIRAVADSRINGLLRATHIISGVAFIYQNRSLSCEEAATSMALTHQGINLSQDQIVADLGADRRAKYVDGSGRVRWGNPYQTFVGSVDGSEYFYTGYGTFYPPLVRIAQAHGASVLAYGNMSAATIYARLIAGHPVVVFATWDWAWHPRHDYLSFDGQWIPWIGPVYASHVYTAVGVSPTAVLVNDPLRGQYWVDKASFEAAYSDFNEAIVFA